MGMDFILDNVAIGEYEEAVSPPPEISALLCVAQERNLSSPNLPYYKVPIIDMRPIPADQLKDAVTWIHRMVSAGGRILVFCNLGNGRSPSVVISYLCCRKNLSFAEAVEMVARKRPNISILPKLILSIEEILSSEKQGG
jgi:protein-tyrosine phosphatase